MIDTLVTLSVLFYSLYVNLFLKEQKTTNSVQY